MVKHVRYHRTMKPITPTALRADLYNLLDQVIETGKPLEIKRNGKKLRLVLDEKPTDIFDNLTPRNAINGDPEDLVDFKVYEWKPDPDLV